MADATTLTYRGSPEATGDQTTKDNGIMRRTIAVVSLTGRSGEERQ
jgi:hypothetical protein